MRISEHFHLQVFPYQLFLDAVFQNSVRGATKHLRLSFQKNRQQILTCFHHECLDSVVNLPILMLISYFFVVIARNLFDGK